MKIFFLNIYLGSPFNCQVVDVNRVTLFNHDANKPFKFPINRQNSIELNANESLSSNINAVIRCPSGKTLQVSRSISQNGNLKLTFQAHEVGKSYKQN